MEGLANVRGCDDILIVIQLMGKLISRSPFLEVVEPKIRLMRVFFFE